ncbi:unnamed protein product, partial [marine sediment metagenome]
EKFLIKFESRLKNEKLYNFELLKILVKYHHSTKKKLAAESNYYKKQSEEEKDKVWGLLKIIKDADSYSCKERDVEEQSRRDHSGKVAPLDSIFSQISLGSKNDKDVKISDKYYRYRINSINPLYSFPDKFTTLDKNEIIDHVMKFENNLPDFSKLTAFKGMLNVWLNLLEEYTWCIPSDTRYEKSDVSLFDHLRSTSAIAACLFNRHILEISKSK